MHLVLKENWCISAVYQMVKHVVVPAQDVVQSWLPRIKVNIINTILLI